MLNSNSEHQNLRLPFHPHWDSGGYLHDWNSQHCAARRRARAVGKAAAFVGRVGVLAVTFGIGTAVATGCIACAAADADTGDVSSLAGAATSTSQSVHPGRRASASNDGVRTTVASESPGSSQSLPATAPRRTAVRLAGGPSHSSDTSGGVAVADVIRVAIPDAVTSSANSTVPAAALRQDTTAAAVQAQVPAATQIADIPSPLPSFSVTASSVTVSAPPAVVIASPPAASTVIEPTFTSVLAALSEALMDTTSVPADAALAVMLGAARRETRAVLSPQIAASKAAAAAAASSPSGAEAEKMTIAGAGRSVADKNASGGYAVALSGSGQVSTTLTLPEAVGLTLRLRTTSGAPNMTLSIDGNAYTTLMVNSTSYSDYTFAGGISAGTHVISISTTTATSRNMLYVDTVTTSSGPIVDEFLGNSGSAPSRLWTSRSGSGFDAGSQTYSSGNVFLDGQGHLVIQATRGKKNAYTSGWVWTKNNLTLGYGTVTARVKVPKGQGLWPAVWMMGADSDTLGWPASGEIDIAELPGTTTTVYSTLHGPIQGSTSTQQAQLVSQMPDLSTDYHNYWVRRLPDEITFGVDDVTLGTLTPADLAAGETWVYNRPMYLILNLAVGGSWAGAPDSTTPSPAKMLVESVTFAPA